METPSVGVGIPRRTPPLAGSCPPPLPFSRRPRCPLPDATASPRQPLLPGRLRRVNVRGQRRHCHQPRRQDLRRQRPLAGGGDAGRRVGPGAQEDGRLRRQLLDLALHYPAILSDGRDHRRHQRRQSQPYSSRVQLLRCSGVLELLREEDWIQFLRHNELPFGPGDVRLVDPKSIPVYKQPASDVYKCTNPPSCI